jgi:hypothetical protein
MALSGKLVTFTNKASNQQPAILFPKRPSTPTTPLGNAPTEALPQLGWYRQNPGFSSTYIFALDKNHVWATGGPSLSGLHFFNGAYWKLIEGPNLDIRAMCASDPENLWVSVSEMTGAQSKEAIYHISGSRYTKQFELSDNNGYIESLAAADASHVWATRNSEIYFFNGNTWSQVYTAEGQVQSLSVADSEHVWVSVLMQDRPTHTKWTNFLFFDGTSWSTEYITRKHSVFPSISAVTPNDVWACGWNVDFDGTAYDNTSDQPGDAIILHFNGVSWSQQHRFDKGTALFTRVAGADATHVWAVVREGFALPSGYGGSSWIYLYNGDIWTRQIGLDAYRISAYTDLPAAGDCTVWIPAGNSILFQK